MFKVGFFFFVEIMIWVLLFKIQYGNLYLLIAVFRLWTFNVIIYVTGLKSIIASCFLFFPSVFAFSPPFLTPFVLLIKHLLVISFYLLC